MHKATAGNSKEHSSKARRPAAVKAHVRISSAWPKSGVRSWETISTVRLCGSSPHASELKIATSRWAPVSAKWNSSVSKKERSICGSWQLLAWINIPQRLASTSVAGIGPLRPRQEQSISASDLKIDHNCSKKFRSREWRTRMAISTTAWMTSKANTLIAPSRMKPMGFWHLTAQQIKNARRSYFTLKTLRCPPKLPGLIISLLELERDRMKRPCDMTAEALVRTYKWQNA